MSTFTIKIQQVGQELDVVTLLGPLTASEAKTAVFEQDASWVGALREAGSSALLAGAVELKSGCTYTLTLQRPAGPVYAMLTLKQFIRQPIPKLSRCVTDRTSTTKTHARHPRTFAQVLVWDSFAPEAVSRFEALDDKVQDYFPQVHDPSWSTNGDLSACQMLPTAADESDVRGYIFRILDCLSMLAPKLGLGFEYIGAGSNRNFCFTDILLRGRRNTDIAHLSAANWGIIQVKGAWQLNLPDNMSLAKAIDHSDYCKEVLPALQQAYGAAVVEEAPIFAITNYEVTFFCRRHLTDVKDTRIWASPPIAWNSASLPPRAAWLHFLAVAQHCRSVYSKSLLRRDEVPSTSPSGYPVVSSSAATVKLNASEPNRNQTDGT